MDVAAAVRRAYERIREHVRETPVERSPVLERAGARCVHLKLENQQCTGSFKVRGATNKLLALPPAARRRGVVAASSGNHGAGVAHAARTLACSARVFVPTTTPGHKIAAIASRGAEVVRVGEDCVVTEAAAREHADQHGLTYISPYNDADVIAGQGTLGLELERQLTDLDVVFLALGGGGLLAGVGGLLKACRPGVEIVACSPARSAVMHASLEAGQIVEVESRPTLSDATAGGVEPDAMTFALCRQTIDRSIVVDEDRIAPALRMILEHHHTLIEGAAAVAVAGYLQEAPGLRGRSAAIVLCGANIGLETLRGVLQDGHEPRPDRRHP